ncbi:hypothetical protein [Nonomuraea roseoviolacea]|uniref:Uncharacterized protein n=1 Tax=Nonomuraea roseoviolacea subsp. carminata TaxID=160689 RepID=A0ABT1K9A7_9ACTN|nr:hypothetical protein [Nonomuraea roseoviolacea]MCP2350580.1 hypothetical protein [Nonomuraea roseoviolacea subsp. carminata]
MPQTLAPALVPQQRRPCPVATPWCVRHDHSESICAAADTPVPGPLHYGTQPCVGLMANPDFGTVIHIYLADDPHTLDEAEEIALAILAKVAAARGTEVAR